MTNKLLFPEEINERVKNGMGCGSQIGEGWFELVRQLDTDISKIAPDYIVDQVKEKFGGVRYYISDVPEYASKEVYALIREAEDASRKTCDVCGNPAETATFGYLIATRCKDHAPT